MSNQQQHGQGVDGVNLGYDSTTIPTAAALYAAGGRPGSTYELQDTGVVLMLAYDVNGPYLFALVGSGEGAGPGVATIAMGATTSNAVADANITATSTVLFSVTQAAPDATATSFSVNLNPGVGFTFEANAMASANVTIRWLVAGY